MSSEKSRLFSRKLKKSIRTLTLTLGSLSLVLAVITFALSFLQVSTARERIQNISFVLGSLGLAMFAIFLLFYILPDALKRRRSPSWKRRDAIYGSGVFQGKADGVRPVEGQKAILPPREQRDGGAVLVIVLAVLAAVAAIVVQVQLTARARQQITDTAVRRAGLQRAAADAVLAALHRLSDDKELLFDGRDDDWAAREETRTPSGIETLTTVVDENRCFDLNNIARRSDRGTRPVEEIMRGLLNQSGRFDEGPCVRALQDWTDPDNTGAQEGEIYRDRKPGYTCPNRMLLSWNELFAIDGWKPEFFLRRPASSYRGGFNSDLLDSLTLLPVKEERVLPVNVNTANRATLLGILGIEQDVIANAILSMRKIQPIKTVDDIQPLMEPAVFAQVSPYLSVRSDYFRVESSAYAGASRVLVRALAHRSNEGRVDIVQWMVN